MSPIAAPETAPMSPAPQTKATALVWCSSVDPAGGMERVALNVANGLAGAGWRIVLAGPFSRVKFLHRAIRPDVEFIEHETSRSLNGMVRTARFLRRTVKERCVDVISAHGSVFPLLSTAVPVVWTEHDLRYAGGEMLRGLRGIAWRTVRRRLESGQWRLVAVSQYVRNETCLKLRLPAESGRVVYNGLPNAAALESLPPPTLVNPYRIGFLGRLVESKRPLEVFPLSKLLNRMGLRHVWHVFGDGVLLPAMRQAAAKSDGHSVVVHGLVEKPEEAFAQIDLLAFLARGEQEGLGMVLLEALAANRLVVAWDAGCIREVLQGRATLVPAPFSLERYAEAIVASIEGRGLPQAGRDARWGEPRMIADYDAILSEAVRAGRHRTTVRRCA